MAQILPYIQIVLSILLIGGVLLQRSEASLGSAFGGDSSSLGHFTRRGFEKTLFNATIVVAILFVASAFANLII
ncbi:preprotein translocase subunit SecG [Candidatus Parcubacteria bacterium]|nr:preprotein translocase subunit SecG [Candidatus Parcubacteria bacterium]